MHNAILIEPADNVAVVIEPVARGAAVVFGSAPALTAREDIPIYHKIAVRDIAAGEKIVKYGEHIGIASQDIKTGEHVHTHNVEGHRENLEEKV